MIGTLSPRYVARPRYLRAPALAAAARRAAGLLTLWRRRARERRLLAVFDDRSLRDIGITRLDAARECAKPFWRA